MLTNYNKGNDNNNKCRRRHHYHQQQQQPTVPNSTVRVSQVFFGGGGQSSQHFFIILTSPRIYAQGFAKLIPVPIIVGRVNCSIRLGFCVPNQYANQSFKLYLV